MLSANVHLDEATPHLHLVFIPVVHSFDKKSGKVTDKICCSDFWKGRDSYKILQDNFHKYMVRAGFNVERGLEIGRKNIPIEKYKELTNYEMQEYKMQNINLEKEKEIIDTEELKKEYKRVIRKFNKLAKHYTRIKTITDTIIQKQETLQNENKEIIQENRKLENENNYLKNFIDKTFEYVSILFDFPKERLKRLVRNFVDMMKGE
ncbi:MAG TPA: plasmid recombination protein [Candidatus Scatovivens faecipullorum]|nr:plasmid recombination protein [Candidatus Scatovivens faecipullorum]